MSLDKEDWERLEAIRCEMQELLEEAKHLVRRSGERFEYERAKAYWIGYMDNALEDAKFPLMPCTMGDTIRALDPGEEEDEDEDIEEDAVESSAGNSG